MRFGHIFILIGEYEEVIFLRFRRIKSERKKTGKSLSYQETEKIKHSLDLLGLLPVKLKGSLLILDRPIFCMFEKLIIVDSNSHCHLNEMI